MGKRCRMGENMQCPLDENIQCPEWAASCQVRIGMGCPEVIAENLSCDEVPNNIWVFAQFTEWCYFMPQRDCPGWVAGQMCGRLKIGIPEKGERE